MRIKAARWQGERPPPLSISRKTRVTLRLLASLFLFDSFLQNILSKNRRFCRGLSKNFIGYCRCHKKDVKCQNIFWKRGVSAQWQPYIAKESLIKAPKSQVYRQKR